MRINNFWMNSSRPTELKIMSGISDFVCLFHRLCRSNKGSVEFRVLIS
jgi:hypothetical protein